MTTPTLNFDEYSIVDNQDGTLTVEHDTSGKTYTFDDTGQLTTESLGADDTINNRVQVGPADDVQNRLNDAGVGGVVVFEPGTYDLDSSVSPNDQQTIYTPSSAEFRPTGDNTCWNFNGVTEVSVQGELHVNDPNSNSTSAKGVIVQGVSNSYFQRITVDGYFDAIALDGNSGDVLENTFGSIYIPDFRNNGLQLLNSGVHDNHFGNVWIEGEGSGTSGDTGLKINTSGVDGGNMFGRILSLNCPNDGMQVAGLNREFWVGEAILDSNGAHGFNHFATGNRAAFFGSLWTSGNGGLGMRVSGAGTANSEKVWDVQIANHYGIGNTDKGVAIENADGIQIGNAIERNNSSGGLAFQTGTSDNCYIGRLEGGASNDSPANGGPTLIGTQAGSNCVVGSLHAPEGTTDAANLRHIDGSPLPENLSGVTGNFVGEARMDDGTNVSTTGPLLCFWTGGAWQPSDGGSTFT